MSPLLALSLLLLLGCACRADAADRFEWGRVAPADAGFDPHALQRAADDLLAHHTQALLIVRDDSVVLEAYADGFARHKPHYTASLAKALVGGVGLALTMDQDGIKPEDLARAYVPAWRDEPVKSKITVRDLASHQSGLQDAEHDEGPAWMTAFWKRERNPFLISRDEVPVLFEPGTANHYSNPGIAMLGWCLAAALEDSPEPDLQKLLEQRVMEPLGVPGKEWSISYGRLWETDGLKLRAPWGGGGYSADAVARVGRLMLRRGDWEGQRLIRPEVVDRVLADAGGPTPNRAEEPRLRSGLSWWLNSDGWIEGLPRDAFFGAGAEHQILMGVPSLNLIVVRMGGQLAPGDFWPTVIEHLVQPVIGAMAAADGIAASPVLRGVEFAPVERIVRRGIDSDNWPWTMLDPETMLVAYGDGWGFEPRVPDKLSLGLGTVTGSPADPICANLRSPTAEKVGDGARGIKTSGLINTGDKLVMISRNAGNSQLAWSTDNAKTWAWGERFTTSFGCPTFVNGARTDDGYVYLLSPDGDSAYESADAVVLARAPRAECERVDAYEYFAGLDAAGAPSWSAAIAARQPVIARRGGCLRLDPVYVPGLDRYLLALGHDHAGGWGIYDAPEPWGPWTRVWMTDDWGLGETHGYRLPSCWFSADGLTGHLVFSGRREYDAFCVREFRLTRR